MDDALEQYDDMIENGHDNKFKIFMCYVAEQVPYQINAFMANSKTDDFFKCEETDIRNYFGTCRCFYDDENIKGCDDSNDCKNGKGILEIACQTEFEHGEVGDWLTPDSD